MIIYFVAAITIAYALIFIYKTKTGSPYLPSGDEEIIRTLRGMKKGSVVADLGCGDGRLLIEAVKAGAKEAHGWEIEPAVYVKALQNVRQAGLQGKVFIHFGDMWRAPLGRFDVVFIYQLERYAKRFVKKFRKEMSPEAVVVANTYPLRELKPFKTDGKLYFYRV